MRIFFLLIWLSYSARGVDLYYVDSARTSNGDGSADNPWKLVSDINWTSVSNSAISTITTLYFSSRGSWSPPSQAIAAKAHGTTSFRFTMDGDSFYNTVASGTAVWQNETTGSRAIMAGGANFVLESWGMHDFTLRGFYFVSPLFSAVFMLPPGATATNVWNVSTYNCGCNESLNGHGYAGDSMIGGCSNIVVSGCQFTNTIGEAIYMTAFDNLTQNVPGILVESNLLVNCGTPGHEGDIDIKPGGYGAIVRYNTHYHTSHTNNAPFTGVVIGADACQVYGNIFHGCETNDTLAWGNGIYLTADGDATTGKAITSCLIYNNAVYDCEQSGIKILATSSTVGANITGVKIWNNTIVGNWANGISIGTASGRTVTISEFKNNILAGNTNFDFIVDSGVTLSSVDYNLYYRTSGNSWSVNGASKTFAQWQALGFDAHGVNGSDPLFVSSTSDFRLQSSSPAKNTGVMIADFGVDLLQITRPQESIWDIGAYEFPLAAPTNLRIDGTSKLSGRVN